MTRFSSFLVLLVMLFVVGCSGVDTSDPEEVEETGKYPHLNRKEIFDGITWVGRVVECEEEDCETPSYELLRLATDGVDEVVLYQSLIDGVSSDVEWNFSEEESVFYFTHVIGYGEGTKNVDILFREGDELIRADYGEFWGITQNLTLKVDEKDYSVELETSKNCFSEERNSGSSGSMTEGAETELLGLHVGTEFISLPTSETVSCIFVDGSSANPVIESISMENGSMTLLLPGEIQAVLQVDEETGELEVSF